MPLLFQSRAPAGEGPPFANTDTKGQDLASWYPHPCVPLPRVSVVCVTNGTWQILPKLGHRTQRSGHGCPLVSCLFLFLGAQLPREEMQLILPEEPLGEEDKRPAGGELEPHGQRPTLQPQPELQMMQPRWDLTREPELEPPG